MADSPDLPRGAFAPAAVLDNLSLWGGPVKSDMPAAPAVPAFPAARGGTSS